MPSSLGSYYDDRQEMTLAEFLTALQQAAEGNTAELSRTGILRLLIHVPDQTEPYRCCPLSAVEYYQRGMVERRHEPLSDSAYRKAGYNLGLAPFTVLRIVHAADGRLSATDEDYDLRQQLLSALNLSE